MPELLEVEFYRRLADTTVGRRIAGVEAPDAWYLQGGLTAEQLAAVLPGCTVTGTRRRGKLLLVDLDGGPAGTRPPGSSPDGAAPAGTGPGGGAVLGLRFGMTGRLLVDGQAVIERLEYGSNRNEPAWVRFRLHFTGGGTLELVDPRRLGGVLLDPDEARLGPDATTVTVGGLRGLLERSAAPLKARLMDQARLAGLGNLLTDEVLWRAKLAPTRPADGLDDVELRRLHRTMRRVLVQLEERGGSHTGDLQVGRARGAPCPRCGEPLARAQVGGRTTYWCPAEQH